jgi:hypothetical protein
MNPQSSTRVSLHFALFATITAGMVGLGQGSANLPLLVFFCGLVSLIYTDKLGWIVLPQWMVFIAMIVGAAIAIFGFLGNVAANQIVAVGNLLVYVQLPLMFQRKSKRVYEHWGVFLLLELVVAALVNDNVLYGIMMLPMLALGCATMMALAHYASLLRHSESSSESTSFFARVLHWLGREDSTTKLRSGISMSVPQHHALTAKTQPTRFAPAKWLLGILPISFGVLLFSMAYFYSLPRLNSESYDGAIWGSLKIGFNEQISLRHIGDMLQNDAPAFRMSMRDTRTQSNYRPSFPPYIRVTVSRRYYDGPSKGVWQSGDRDISMDPRIMQKMPFNSDLRSELNTEADAVTVTVVEKSSFGPYVPAIAPFARAGTTSDFRILCNDWSLVDSKLTSRTTDEKRRYSFSTYAFTNGVQSTLMPDYQECIQEDKAFPFAFETRPSPLFELTEFPSSLDALIPIRDKILAPTKNTNPSKLSQSIILSDYLASGKEYSYSLSLSRPVDPNVDPIVDFMLNRKKGHCQYFASALAMMLRSLDIPTRLVIGFRPNEYNEIGQYFSVQHNHAHVWVEAYFTAEELRGRYLSMPEWVQHGAWVRMDPTPAGAGSNAGETFRSSRGQTLDVMQDLWNEMVMNMDKSKQSNLLSLFGESSSSSYSDFWNTIRSAVESMTSSRLVGGLMSPERWFSWQVAVSVMIFGSGLLLGYRFLIAYFPQWSFMRRWKSKSYLSGISHVDFYDRMVRALRRHGLQRSPSQTPLEFLRIAQTALAQKAIAFDADWVASLFYARRYGDLPRLNDHDQTAIQQLLQAIEAKPTRIDKQGRS